MLGWGKILDYLGGCSVITGALISGTEMLKRQNQRDGGVKKPLLALKMEGGAMSQEMQADSINWEGQGTDFPLGCPKQNTTLPLP